MTAPLAPRGRAATFPAPVAAPTVDAQNLTTGTIQMIPATANEYEPDDRLTSGGLVFLAISIVIVIGMGIGGGHTYSLVAGVAMLILSAIFYFVGIARLRNA
jgi:hypothetical protein